MMHKALATTFIGLSLLRTTPICLAQDRLPAPNSNGQPAAAVPTDRAVFRQQVSYSLGLNIGAEFRQNEMDIDVQSLAAGISDALSNAAPRLSQQQIAVVMERFQQEMQQKAMQRRGSAAVRNKQQEEAFLAKNREADGVIVTQTGLQYKVLRQGNGASPKLTDTVRAHYHGTLLDGTVFDSSYSRNEPIEMRVDQFVAGWKEALQLMKVGDKWKVYVPAGLAYGMDPPPGSPIEPGSMLVFDLELLDVVAQ